MTCTVYGKKNCGLCDAAKEKLTRMGIPFDFVDLLSPDEMWRCTHITDAMAIYQMQDEHEKKLPIIELNGEFLTYPQAMRALKGPMDNKAKRVDGLTWCPHVGGLGPPFPFCPECAAKHGEG